MESSHQKSVMHIKIFCDMFLVGMSNFRPEFVHMHNLGWSEGPRKCFKINISQSIYIQRGWYGFRWNVQKEICLFPYEKYWNSLVFFAQRWCFMQVGKFAQRRNMSSVPENCRKMVNVISPFWIASKDISVRGKKFCYK